MPEEDCYRPRGARTRHPCTNGDKEFAQPHAQRRQDRGQCLDRDAAFASIETPNIGAVNSRSFRELLLLGDAGLFTQFAQSSANLLAKSLVRVLGHEGPMLLL